MTNHPSRKQAAADRTVIREWALARGERYRILRDGQVNVYGRMPNSTETGWWYAGYAADLLADIKAGNR